MKKGLVTIFIMSICLYGVFNFLMFMTSSEIIVKLLSIFGVVALFSGLALLPINKAGVPLFIMILVLTIAFLTDVPLLDIFMEGIKQMSGLIVLLLIVPMIGWTLRQEPYMESIMNLARNLLNTSKKFYFGMMALTQVIAYFLLFGAIPMVNQLLNDVFDSKKGEAWDNYRSTALLRGFALTTMWVISIPSFVFAVDHLGASLSISILQGFIISLCGIMLAIIFSKYQEKRYGIDITAGIQEEIQKIIQDSPSQQNTNGKALEFLILFVSLFGTIFLLHGIWKWELLKIIPLVIIGWTCLYFIIKRKASVLLQQAKQYFTHDLQFQAQQFSILLAAGTLIFTINESGLGNHLVDLIFYIADSIPFINVLWIIPFVVILLGFLGLGPLTVIALVAGILEYANLPYPPELVVLSITSGSVISILLSPFILPVIVLSASNGLSIFKNGFLFNYRYAIAFYFVVQLYLQFMVHI